MKNFVLKLFFPSNWKYFVLTEKVKSEVQK